LRSVLEACSLQSASAPVFVSCLTGVELEGGEAARPEYWLGHDEARPVRFQASMQTLDRLGCDAFLEIGPSTLLLRLGRQCLPEVPTEAWLPSL
ncbi:unnamed protein product, partial [Polarella glacialis]